MVAINLHSKLTTFKPIFHCDAKYLASGVGVGQCPRRQNFALEIPTCWYILALPNAKICVFPDANPRRQSVEYRFRWVPTQNAGIGHVHFMFLCRFHLRLVPNAKPISSGICALDSQRMVQEMLHLYLYD